MLALIVLGLLLLHKMKLLPKFKAWENNWILLIKQMKNKKIEDLANVLFNGYNF